MTVDYAPEPSVSVSVAGTDDVAQPADAGLLGMEGNPVPDGAVLEWVVTPDGTRLRTARWAARDGTERKGTVVVLSGRTEIIEEYFETVEELRHRGFGAVVFDWRGQGGSTRALHDRQKGHVDDFDQYLTDLETVLDDIVLPDCRPPFYILGHSAGSLVALRAAPALGNRITRMVLLAPLLSLADLPVRQRIFRRIMGFLSLIGLGRMAVEGKRAKVASTFDDNKLTSDPERFARNRALFAARPDLSLGSPTISWLFAACRAMYQVRRESYSQAISIPTLFVLAGQDEVVDVAVGEDYADGMRTGGFITIDGARHEILHERDLYRAQFWAAFDAFVPGSSES